MDYKSVDDLSILSRESIINEYHVLYECYKEQKLSEHRQLQEIHQLRRGITDKFAYIFVVVYLRDKTKNV